MIGYVTLGTNDLERADAFYGALLSKLTGAKRLYATDRMIAWGFGRGKPLLMVTLPYDENEATVGNGVMVALQVENKDAVHTVYDAALELGATDEGPPGPRGESGFYGGYFRDLDGNKLAAYFYG
jgi:predicted lactoylglutathione lyase